MTPNELIKLTRIKSGFSQADFAIRAGVSKRSLEKWEQGATVPNSNDLFKCLNFVNAEILKNVEKMLK